MTNDIPEIHSVAGLVEFLAARLNADEQVIREHAEYWGPTKQRYDSGLTSDHEYHSVDISPARVLADVAAKRTHIADYQQAERDWALHNKEAREYLANLADTVGSLDVVQIDAQASALLRQEGRLRAVRAALERVVRVDALPYTDHPDYDPGWRP